MNTPLVGVYDYRLATLSALITVIAAYVALELAGHVFTARGGARQAFLCGSAAALGAGIWASHYIGLEAFHLPIPVLYDLPTVLLSLFTAMLGSGVALYTVSRMTWGRVRWIAGGIVLGGGIAAMHYVGIEAMRLRAMCIFTSWAVAGSILLTMALSIIALQQAFLLPEMCASGWRKFNCTVMLVLAVAVTHYAGMTSVHFIRRSSITDHDLVNLDSVGFASIGVMVLLLLTLVALGAMVDRRFSLQEPRFADNLVNLQAVIDTMTEAFVIVDAQRGLVQHNRAACELLGLENRGISFQEMAGAFDALSPTGEPLRPEEWPIMRAMHGDFCKNVEVTIRRKDTGAMVATEISTLPIATERHDGRKFIVSLRDIQERNQMDEVRTQLVAIVESTGDAIIGRDENGIITTWNRGAQILYGYAPEEIVGQSITILNPEKLHGENERLQKATAEGRSVNLDETTRSRKDGSLVQVSLAISPLKDFQGNISGAAIIARDITERMKEQEALREQAHLLDSAQVFIRDLESRVAFWPRSAQTLYGFTSEEAVGQLSHDLLKTQFSEPLERILKSLFETGIWEGELIHRRRDGNPIIVHSTWVLHCDRNGRAVSILENNIDITARKQAETKLISQAKELASQAEGLAKSQLAMETQAVMLQSVLSSMSEGLVVVDKQGEFVIWNPAAERIVGLGPENLTSEKWTEHYGLYLPDMVTPFPPQENPLALAIQGKDSIAEMYILNRKLTVGRFVEANASPLREPNGTICGGVTAFRDITERKLMDEARGRLVAIVESSEDAIIGKSEKGIVMSWNRGAEKVFGYTSAEMIGQSVLRLMPPGHEHEEDGILQRIRRGETVEHIESQRRRKDGEIIYVSLMISPIRDASGKVVGASKIARDITEKRQLERQLQQSQKMDAIGQLTGGIGHDFNNLLGIILGNLDLLEGFVAEDETALDQVRTSQRAATRGADLTRRLLTFARMEGLKPSSIFLHSSIGNTVAMATRVLGPKITIKTLYDNSLPRVFVDAVGMESAVLNLMLNARDAMPTGGLISISTRLIELDRSCAPVDLGELKNGWYACVSISDTGDGMSRETRERAFEPFFTTKPRDKGTGLGLAMVYGFVKQSGGAVRIYSELGEGTTVSMYLPLSENSSHPEAAFIKESLSNDLDATVLVVDDESDLLNIVMVYLAEMGCTALQAIDGTSAIEIVKREKKIDLMVTDIIMPGGMSGVELADRVHEMRPQIKIVYASGFPADSLAERKISMADRPLLRKPYQRAEFRATVRNMLQSANARLDSLQ